MLYPRGGGVPILDVPIIAVPCSDWNGVYLNRSNVYLIWNGVSLFSDVDEFYPGGGGDVHVFEYMIHLQGKVCQRQKETDLE